MAAEQGRARGKASAATAAATATRVQNAASSNGSMRIRHFIGSSAAA